MEKTAKPGSDEFEKLVGLYYEPLYRFAMSLSHSESEAGDLVQDTFLAWAEKGGQMADPSKAKSWLFTTLHRRFLQTRRRAVRFPHTELDETVEVLPSIEPEVVQRLEAADLMEALRAIDPHFQAAVALFYLEDYSYAEIAVILEAPIGTVKSRIARGLSQLKREILSREPESSPDGKEAT